ncbi:MAG: multidrug effflux MFS transporter [Acetobacteraceae bacterium]
MTVRYRIAPESFLFTVLLGVFAGLPALSIDVSAPTLVALPAALATSTLVAGLTLSLFMAGFALGQLAGGLLSDRYGRRPVLLVGLSLYTVAGVCCAVAISGPGLAASRLVQGVGAGSCSVLALAIVQDLFQGEAARKKRSYITVVFGAVPVLAPALGAWVAHAAGWRAVYVVLAVAGVLLLLVVWLCLAESRSTGVPARIAPSRLDRDRRFMGIVAANALSYGMLFAYIAGAPVVTIGQMGLSASTYAVIFALTALALSGGAWCSALLSSRVSAQRLVGPGLAGKAAAAVVFVLVSLGVAGDGARPSAGLLIALLMLICFGRGVAAPNLAHLAIGARRSDSGLASAVFGLTQLLGGAAASALVAALLPSYGLLAVSGPMAAMACAALAVWLGLRRSRPGEPEAT